jgi:predicted secreted protein
MKRSLSVVIMLSVIVMLSGCIVSTTPKDNPVVLLPGQAKTFTIQVFPFPLKYVWLVDGNVVPGATRSSLVYILNEVLPSDFTIEVRATGLLGTDKYTWNVHYVGTNKPPVAEAGPDQITRVGYIVILDGSGSTDPENNIVSYHWEQTGGTPVTLSDPNAIKPQFVANVPLGSILVFTLSITDAGSLSDVDTCAVSVDTTIWNKTFGGSKYDWGCSVQHTTDGGYILAGGTSSYGAGSVDAWLIKTDANGNKVWDKTFGGSSSDYAYAVLQTSDGGYILAGSTASFGAGNGDAWLIKTDANGNKVWDKTFGGINSDSARSVQQTKDGGYILAGNTWSSGAGGRDAWLIKTDTNGNEQWNKTYGGALDDLAMSVEQTSDGGYIVAAFTTSYGAGSYDAWLIKTDEYGNKEWEKFFGGDDFDEADSVHQTSDGGYILAGHTNSFGVGSFDAWLIRTDVNGVEQWNKTYGGSGDDGNTSVQLTSDGGYILAVTTSSYGAGSYDAWLIKTDADGNKAWDKTFGGSGYDCANAVNQTSDGGYILAGETGSYGAGNRDAWLIKTDAEGNAPTTPSP